MLQGQHDLDQTRGSGCRFGVTDVALDRSHQQRPVGVTGGTVNSTGRLHLDRVAERRTGSVRLEVVDVAAGQAGPGQRGGDKPLLCTTIGHSQAAGRAVLVDGAARDHRGNPVAVALRVAEPLEHQDPAAFTAHIAVSRRIERLALPDR